MQESNTDEMYCECGVSSPCKGILSMVKQSIRQRQNVVKFILAHAREKWAFSGILAHGEVGLLLCQQRRSRYCYGWFSCSSRHCLPVSKSLWATDQAGPDLGGSFSRLSLLKEHPFSGLFASDRKS